MSKLASLHSQLAALRRTRATARLVTALAAVATAILWALIGIFILDVLFELPLLPRLVVIVLGALASFWAFTKYTRPLLGVRESELDMALMVERQQNIDSDLVAALQFESADATRWGSPQLETAVINYVAEFGRSLNVFEGFSREQMVRRGTILGVTLVVVVGFLLIAPSYASVFLNRLFLGHQHYPSATVIEQVLVNDTAVLDYQQHGAQPLAVKGAQGQPMLFYVQCSGELPVAGTLRVRSASGGAARPVELKPLTMDQRAGMLRTAQAKLAEALAQDEIDIAGPWQTQLIALTTFDAPAATQHLRELNEDRSRLTGVLNAVEQTLAEWPAKADQKQVYQGDMGRLVDEVSYGIAIGDAWTDPALVRMIPLPVVELEPKVVPPKYAQGHAEPESPTSRQLSVLEGSTVQFTLRCVNEKPLKEVWMTAKGKGGAKKLPLVKTDAEGLVWTLPAEQSPLQQIREEIRFEIQVTDHDDLHLESPIRGVIRLRADRPPTGAAEVVHRVVLPTAKPIIHYRVSDDYGIAQLALQVAIERNPEALGTPELEPASTSTDTTPGSNQQVPPVSFSLHAPPQAPISAARPVRGTYALDLAPLMLAKGDRLKLTLAITDYRGDTPGESYLSDPLILEISDESGVLAAISEADERSEQRLTDIIKKQLGIGESP